MPPLLKTIIVKVKHEIRIYSVPKGTAYTNMQRTV